MLLSMMGEFETLLLADALLIVQQRIGSVLQASLPDIDALFSVVPL